MTDGTASLDVMLSSRAKGAVNQTLTDAGGGVRMTDGTDVRIRGRLDWYSPRGQLQLRMTAIDPAYTLGQLEVARAALLARLAAEGLLRANGTLTMPLAPLRVGLVTSEGSAAEADFLDELRRSGFAFQVLRVDTRVQGPDAPRSIGSAIRMLCTHPLDVLALVRGGGARTDLAAFDDEAVARAIAGCPVPVLTGVGHEVDTSVADEVAHTTAKTPTACAQLLVARVGALAGRLDSTWAAIATRGVRNVALHDDRLVSQARHLSRERGGWRWIEAEAVGGRRRSIPPCVAGRSRRRESAARGAPRPHDRRRGARTCALPRRTWPPTNAGWPTGRPVPSPSPSARSVGSRRACGRSTPTGPWRGVRSITRGPDGQVLRSAAGLSPGDEITTVLAQGQVRLRCPLMADDAAPEIGYAQAVEELEEILAELDGDDVDVDVLAERVKRGADLVQLCRARITAASRGHPHRGRPRSRNRGTTPATASRLSRTMPGPDPMLDSGSAEPPHGRRPVEARLRQVLTAETRRWAELSGDLEAPLESLARFVLAGGKRLRPAFCYLGRSSAPAAHPTTPR